MVFIIGSKPIDLRSSLVISNKDELNFSNTNLILHNMWNLKSKNIRLFINFHNYHFLSIFQNTNYKISDNLLNYISNWWTSKKGNPEFIKRNVMKEFLELYKQNIDNIQVIGYTHFRSNGKELKNCSKELVYESSLLQANEYLKSLGYDKKISQSHTMGMMAVINSIKRKVHPINVIGFSVEKKSKIESFYTNYKNDNRDSGWHNWEEGVDLLLWLHRNNYIDITYCFLNFKNDKVILNTKNIVQPTEAAIKKLREVFGEKFNILD